MKPMVLILCTALAAATGASAAEPFAAPERDKAVMLYFAKSFGSTQRQNRTPLQFGLRLQQSSPFGLQRPVSLLDVRYSLSGRKTLLAGGAVMLEAGKADGGSSTAESFEDNPWLWAVAGLAALGIACGFEVGICDNSGPGGTSRTQD